MGDGKHRSEGRAILRGIGELDGGNGESIRGTARTPLRQAWGESTRKGHASTCTSSTGRATASSSSAECRTISY